MQGMIIRDAIREDVEALAELMGYLGYPTSIQSMQDRFERISAHPSYRTLIAEYDGRVIGMAGLTTGHYYELDESYARISAFVVHPGYRRRSIGRSLIRAAEQRAASLGIQTVSLGNGTHRPGAHRFYEDSGYEITVYRFFKSLRPNDP